ncbi:MAG TPA: hypothetical protein VGR89_09765, partial [Puia sp.]|nr:hypothetical protein [Puia sp.]
MRKLHLAWLLGVSVAPLIILAQTNTADQKSSTGAEKDPSASASNPVPSNYKTFKEAYAAGNDALKDRKFEESATAYGAAEELASNPKAKSQAANAQGW